MTEGKQFTPEEAQVLQDIILHRRDVRGNRFVDRPLEQETIDRLLMAALHAPSVGFSQPWEFVLVTDRNIRGQIRALFDEVNTDARAAFSDRGEAYSRLKLEGILEAPLNIAVFYRPSGGAVLGQTSFPPGSRK